MDGWHNVLILAQSGTPLALNQASSCCRRVQRTSFDHFGGLCKWFDGIEGFGSLVIAGMGVRVRVEGLSFATAYTLMRGKSKSVTQP